MNLSQGFGEGDLTGFGHLVMVILMILQTVLTKQCHFDILHPRCQHYSDISSLQKPFLAMIRHHNLGR